MHHAAICQTKQCPLHAENLGGLGFFLCASFFIAQRRRLAGRGVDQMNAMSLLDELRGERRTGPGRTSAGNESAENECDYSQ